MATPAQIAAALDAISTGIGRAKNPSASKVAADLKCVVAALEGNGEASARVARMAAARQASTEKVAPAALPSRSDVASYLEAMADGIDRAKSPSAAKVAADLKCLLAALDGTPEASKRVATVAASRKA